MQLSPLRRSPWTLGAIAAGAITMLAALALGGGTTLGQASPSSTPAATPAATAAPANTAGPQPAPALDNDTAVRMILPESIRNSERLPVHKWARADLPNAPGGYVVFIATIYPIYDGEGGSTEWLLVNYLQWDGYEWLIGEPDDPGVQLTGDDVWLARNLTDITAVAPPPDQSWQVVTVGYTADGLVSPTLARTETVVEIYDLSLTTVWSRVDYLRETDTSNSGYVEQRGEDVDWTFKDLDGDGIAELIATVQDSDTITLNGDAPADATLPAAGTTQTTTTEIWKWINGVFQLQTTQPGGNQPAANPAPAASPTPAPQAPARRATPAPPVASPTRTPTPAGHPAG